MYNLIVLRLDGPVEWSTIILMHRFTDQVAVKRLCVSAIHPSHIDMIDWTYLEA